MKGEHTPFPAWMARTTKSNFHTLNGAEDVYGVVAIVVIITKEREFTKRKCGVCYSDFLTNAGGQARTLIGHACDANRGRTTTPWRQY